MPAVCRPFVALALAGYSPELAERSSVIKHSIRKVCRACPGFDSAICISIRVWSRRPDTVW